jgi:hypothetical protein
LEPLCFVLGKSSAVKDVFENYPDASTFCADKIRSAEKLGLSNMSYVAESVDSLSVFDKKVTIYVMKARLYLMKILRCATFSLPQKIPSFLFMYLIALLDHAYQMEKIVSPFRKSAFLYLT